MGRWKQIAGLVGLAVILGPGRDSAAQGLFPPAPGADLQGISRQMAEALRGLVVDVSAAANRIPNGGYLSRDCQELQQSAGEWFATTQGVNDPYQLRRSYSVIDTAWHRLRGQLAGPGIADPAVLEEVRRVERADAAIHQALNLNAYPPNLEGGAAAPAGVDETRRLAYALAQRGEAVAAITQGTYGNDPNFGQVINDAAEVARLADGFSDGLANPNGAPPIDQAQQAFVPLLQKSNGLGISLDRNPMPPPLRAAWTAYANVLNLLRSNLQLANAPIDFGTPANGPVGVPYTPVPNGQVAQSAEILDRQVDELIANFSPTAMVVPEGREMLEEMQRLRNDVRNFRGDAAQGLDPGRLAYEFREVDADWQRLARRVNRIARGRSGPNIQRVQQVGETCEQIHRVLGMPGYPPVIRPYGN